MHETERVEVPTAPVWLVGAAEPFGEAVESLEIVTVTSIRAL